MSTLTFPTLASYMDRVLSESGQSNEAVPARTTNGDDTSPSPILQAGQINRILVYPGSFNPPHRGHLQVLLHGLHHSGGDYNVVGAIIVFSSDTLVREKYERHGCSDKVLTISQRKSLWTSDDNSPRSMAWAVGAGEEFSKIRSKLYDVLKADGYEAKFVTLYGPDCIDLERMPDPEHSNDVIISERSRFAEDLRSSENDRILDFESTCSLTSWHVVQQEEFKAGVMPKRLHHRMCPNSAQASKDLTKRRQKAVENESERKIDEKCEEECEQKCEEESEKESDTVILECHSFGPPECYVRFLKWNGKREEVSSTMIREMLQKSAEHDLSKVVLSPKLLCEMWFENEVPQ